MDQGKKEQLNANHLLTIAKNPRKILRCKAKDVAIKDIIEPKIQKLIVAMKETLKHTPDGVGLAAPQVGQSLRIFIVSEEAEEIDRVRKSRGIEENVPIESGRDKPYEIRGWKYYIFINPVVKNSSRRKQNGAEGCLSVPGIFGSVVRHEKITVEAYDEKGKKFVRGASHFFARVIQHELDHLEGTLFIDKADNILK